MKHSSRTLISWIVGLFICAQVFSLAGAMDSFARVCIDDTDPEEIVTVDPFVTSNLKTVDVAPIVQFVAVLATALWQLQERPQQKCIVAVTCDFYPAVQCQLWLMHRSLLL